MNKLLRVLLFAVALTAAAQEDSEAAPGEYDVKAAFVYKIATFVDWQESLFDSASAPLVFGILGEDPFGAIFDSVIANKFIGSHPLQAIRANQQDKLPYCHVLFVCQADAKRTPQIVSNLTGIRTLTICDANPAVVTGLMVYLVMQEDRVRLAINHHRTGDAGLKISSRVLKLADEVVEEDRP